MADAFLSLAPEERREALDYAAAQSGRPAHLLEKDVWVVTALEALFSAPFAEHLVFKGGTSLSKAYNVIRRFSEDIDITYDIRALVPDFAAEAVEALPADRAEERRWSAHIRKRLPIWVANEALPAIAQRLRESAPDTEVRAEDEKIFARYEPLAAGSGYVRPEVMVEFGARSTGEPSATRPISCDAAPWLETVAFPTAQPRVMRAERTFWEKATAIHVFCQQQRLRGHRFARHWHDVVRLDDAGIAAAALDDRDLARAVARHKSIFFAEKDARGEAVDYHRAVGGQLHLAPTGAAFDLLKTDYDLMIADGLLLDEAESFEALVARCADLEARANASAP